MDMTHHDRKQVWESLSKFQKYKLNSYFISWRIQLIYRILNFVRKLNTYYMGNDKMSAWMRENVLETSIPCMQEREAFHTMKHQIFVTPLGQQINHLFMNLFGLVIDKNGFDMLSNIMDQILNVFHAYSFIYQPMITSYSSSSKRFVLKSCSLKKENLNTHFLKIQQICRT